MAITNGYCTLEEFRALIRPPGPDSLSIDASDDMAIEDIITDASRLIDAVCGRWFYASTQTRLFSVPDGEETNDPRLLWLDRDLLTVTTLTNGDGTVVAAADYNLIPKNGLPKYGIRLKSTSDLIWEVNSDSSAEYVISVAGSWGYVDRTATDPDSARVIANTRRACLEIALMKYRQRYGENAGGAAQVTAVGVVITPSGALPKAALEAVKPYIRIV